jgi:hypothetical protein
VLRFAVEHFREDLRKLLGLVPITIKLTWDQGFEVDETPYVIGFD